MITKEHIEKSILNTENYTSKLTPEFLAIHDKDSCMSSHKVRILLNNICNFDGCNYLEIGSWRGSTFQSAIFNNNIKATSIDYWPETAPFRESRSIFLRNLYQMSLLETNDMSKDVRIINSDAFKFNKEGLKDINVYLYDGDHSEEAQYKGFKYYNDILSDKFIALIDDWNSENVRLGVFRAFKELNYKLLGEWSLPGVESNWGAHTNYWNGFYVTLIER